LSANEIHVGDVGTVFQATIRDQSGTAVDISGATTKLFLLKQAGGSVTTITAAFVTSGTDGSIKFTSTAAHFDTQGKFKLQAYVTNGTTVWRTDIYEFSVSANLA
jgi:hypothetical protein